MTSDNYKAFCDQLDGVIVKYPNLSIKEMDERKILKGILDIPNDDLNIIGSYFIEIHFTNLFPFRFPKLFEIGGDIPSHIDWHKFSDNSCCITVQPDEIIKCKADCDVEMVGQEWLLQQSKELKQAGVPALHYYTLGKPRIIAEVVKGIS